jgi:glycosyltransferase involved in cell wall biosynthesis
VNVLSKRKEKVIISVHSFMSVALSSRIRKFVVRFIANRAENVVTPSKAVGNDLIKNFNVQSGKLRTIHNACDIESLLSHEPSISVDSVISKSDCFYILSIGSLRKPKGHWHLLKSFMIVHNRYPHARLVILGEGVLKEDLLRLTDLLGLTHFVSFPGFVVNPLTIVKKSNLFVLSSLYEGLGNVILEALGCGKAVVSTDCNAGPREILAPDTVTSYKTDKIEYAKYGVLVPGFDVNEDICVDTTINRNEELLAEAIGELIHNNALREKYEKLGIERIKDFSPGYISKQWIQLIDEEVR